MLGKTCLRNDLISVELHANKVPTQLMHTISYIFAVSTYIVSYLLIRVKNALLLGARFDIKMSLKCAVNFDDCSQSLGFVLADVCVAGAGVTVLGGPDA